MGRMVLRTTLWAINVGKLSALERLVYAVSCDLPFNGDLTNL